MAARHFSKLSHVKPLCKVAVSTSRSGQVRVHAPHTADVRNFASHFVETVFGNFFSHAPTSACRDHSMARSTKSVESLLVAKAFPTPHGQATPSPKAKQRSESLCCLRVRSLAMPAHDIPVRHPGNIACRSWRDRSRDSIVARSAESPEFISTCTSTECSLSSSAATALSPG
jgi:hypothetical protein